MFHFLSVVWAGAFNNGKIPAYITSIGTKPAGAYDFDTVEFLSAEEIGQIMGGN